MAHYQQARTPPPGRWLHPKSCQEPSYPPLLRRLRVPDFLFFRTPSFFRVAFCS